MNEEERQSVIDLINQAPEGVRMFAHAAYLLGHEDGWWLNRTDPAVTINPVDHAHKVNPFTLSTELTDLIAKANKLDPDPESDPQEEQWGVEYHNEVTIYHSEEEARKQWNLATMDVPANLVQFINGKWISKSGFVEEPPIS